MRLLLFLPLLLLFPKALALRGPAESCIQSENSENVFFRCVFPSPLPSKPLLMALLLRVAV